MRSPAAQSADCCPRAGATPHTDSLIDRTCTSGGAQPKSPTRRPSRRKLRTIDVGGEDHRGPIRRSAALHTRPKDCITASYRRAAQHAGSHLLGDPLVPELISVTAAGRVAPREDSRRGARAFQNLDRGIHPVAVVRRTVAGRSRAASHATRGVIPFAVASSERPRNVPPAQRLLVVRHGDAARVRIREVTAGWPHGSRSIGGRRDIRLFSHCTLRQLEEPRK